MDIKKTIMLDYKIKLNKILGSYREEYDQIMKTTVQEISKADVSVANQEILELMKEKENGNVIAQPEYSNDYNNDFNNDISDIGQSFTTISKQEIDTQAAISSLEKEACIKDTLVEDKPNTIDNTLNMHASSINQSFNTRERRKARRMTGKKIIKRKCTNFEEDDYCYKKQRTDSMGSFLLVLSETLQSLKDEKQAQEIATLKAELIKKDKEYLEKSESERKDFAKLREENLAISSKIEQELKELRLFKQKLIDEIKNVEDNRKLENENIIIRKIGQERKEIQEEFERQSKQLEVERTFLIEEKKTLDDFKALETKRIEAAKLEIEREKREEIKRIAEEKLRLEELTIEQSIKIENERRHMKDEELRIKKTLELEKEKISQTFLELENKAKEEIKTDMKVQLPLSVKLELERKRTIAAPAIAKSSINDLFQSLKKEHEQKVTNIKKANVLKEKAIPAEVNFSTPFVQPVLRTFPGFDINTVNPHLLYKKSIDMQTTSNDPKKYIPKTLVPFYATEDEFEMEDKRFATALFTKDPKLNYTVKTQNHEEIRALLGDKKEIDVEKIFCDIENVSNFSPNKLKKKK